MQENLDRRFLSDVLAIIAHAVHSATDCKLPDERLGPFLCRVINDRTHRPLGADTLDLKESARVVTSLLIAAALDPRRIFQPQNQPLSDLR
jgi:hypothetical protein